MSQQSGSAFGAEFAATEEVDAPDFSDEALDLEPGERTQPVPPQQGQQQPAQPQPTQGQEGEQAEQPSEPQPRKYLNRWDTPEEVVEGYRNMQRLHRQTQEQLQAAQLREQRLQASLEQVLPYLRQAQGLSPDGQPQEAQQMPEDLSLLSPQQLQAFIDQRVRQGVEQGTEQVRAQTQEEVTQGQLRSTVTAFMQAHPEVEPDGELDWAVGEVMEKFQTLNGKRDESLFPYTRDNLELALDLAKDPALENMALKLDLQPSRENLEIAKEAMQNQALAEVLIANPTAVDTDEGLTWARKMAGLPGMYAQAAQAAQPPSPQQMRRAATVETGGTGAPVMSAPGQQGDEFDIAVAAYNKGVSNVFGLPVND